jgi:hypothetical protein
VRAKRLQTQCLNELSLKQLKAWIEEDEEKKTNKVLHVHSVFCAYWHSVCLCVADAWRRWFRENGVAS